MAKKRRKPNHQPQSITNTPAPKQHWNAGRTNRAFGSAPVGNAGPNQANLPYLFLLRSRVRDQVRNSPIASRAVDILVSEMIGTGITPLPQAKGDVKTQLTDLWKTWEDYADFDGRTDIYGLQALAVRAWLESGECFIRLFNIQDDGAGVVPLRIQLLEADMVPLANGKAPDTNNEILNGIEFANGQRVAYWVMKKHPGDFPFASAGYIPGDANAYSTKTMIRVPASEMLHLFEATRPGQLRGVPKLSGILQTIAQLKDFDEATLERQKMAAALTYFIRRPAPLDPGVDPVTGLDIDPNVVPESTINPGSAYTLLPGEEIETPDLPELGDSYSEFAKRQDRNIAAGCGIPYELLTGDYTGTNDRLVRVALGAFRRKLQQQQWGVVIYQMCRPIWQAMIRSAVLNGMITIALAKVKIKWSPQAWPYINPVQDIEAQALAKKEGLTSRTAIIVDRGDDPEQVDAERAADQKREDSLGIVTDLKIQEQQATATRQVQQEVTKLLPFMAQREPQRAEPTPAPVFNIQQPAVNVAGSTITNVIPEQPKQEAPQITVENIVNVPDPPAPVVNIENNVSSPDVLVDVQPAPVTVEVQHAPPEAPKQTVVERDEDGNIIGLRQI